MILNNKKKILMLSLLLALILLFVPYAVKNVTDDDTLIGEDSYYAVRIIDQYKNEGIQDTDLLTDKIISFNLYFYLLSILGISTITMSKFIPILLGLLSLLFFYLLLQKLDMKADNILFTLIVLLISPIYLYTFSVFTSEAFTITMLTLSAYLYMRKNYLSAIPLSMALLTNFLPSIAALVFMIAYSLARNSSKKVLFVNIMAVLVVGGLATIFLQFNPLVNIVSEGASISNLIGAFGSIKSYSLILLVLGLIGFSMTWRRSLSQTLLYLVMGVIFAASIFYPDLRLLISMVLAVSAGTAINLLIKNKWNVKALKGITLLLIIYILIFSAGVLLKNEIQQVTLEKVEAIEYLTATEPDDIILSIEGNGFLIEQISGRKVFLDENSFKYADYEEKLKVADSIYYSRNLKQLESILESQNINHILIDEYMRSGGVWDSPDEGVLFLLENSDSFIKIFENNKVQIYRFIGST